MTKGKRKNSAKKRNLKYGNIAPAKPKSEVSGSKGSGDLKTSHKSPSTKENEDFKKELRRSLIFTGSFLLALLVLYFVLTKTNLLNLVLDMLGLGGLYK